MKHKNKTQKGFTLIELLVVSTIIVILSAIGLVSFSNAGKSARDSKRKADLETVRQSLVLYRSDNGTGYPPGSGGAGGYTTAINALGSYVSDPSPKDPKDSGVYVYGYTSDGSTFTLTATMEKELLEGGYTYTISNP